MLVAYCFAVHQKNFGNPFPIYMNIFILQYINVTEVTEKEKRAYDFFYSTKRDFLQKLHLYITQAGYVNTTVMHLCLKVEV